MNKIGTILGIKAVFGGRWDDIREAAKFKSKYAKTEVYFDDKNIDKTAFPAPAIIHQMISVADNLSTYAVFYNDDVAEIFGSIIFSSGRVAPRSEVIYADVSDWEDAIEISIEDSSLEAVHYPVGASDSTFDKAHAYQITKDNISEKDLPKITSASHLKTIGIVFIMLLVMASIPFGIWVYTTQNFEKIKEFKIRIETTKSDMSSVLERCALDLKESWPAPPEWTLRQEGCVLAPELSRVTFPKPTDQRPFAYRFYDLNLGTWDEYLSRASFLKIAERFPGEILKGKNQFVLYIPYDIEQNIIDNDYIADTNPTLILRQNFVGIISLSGSGPGGVTGVTDLELQRTIKRLAGELLTPSHVYRNLESKQTRMEIGSEQIKTREIRIDSE